MLLLDLLLQVLQCLVHDEELSSINDTAFSTLYKKLCEGGVAEQMPVKSSAAAIFRLLRAIMPLTLSWQPSFCEAEE